MAGQSELTERSDKKIKITDLNIDCLEEIFKYLDLSNLLNVANSNKWLKIAASFVFRRNYGKKRVTVIQPYGYEGIPLRVYCKNVIVRATFSLRFLRYFGCIVSKLEIILDNISQKQVYKICFYINEYCTESLIELEILGFGINNIIFRNIQKPFVNIEMVSFRWCHLEKNLIQFNKWFPKMRHLELNKNKIDEEKCIEMHFPNLRYLSYHPARNDKEYFAPNFGNIIRLNPNIRILHLFDWSEKLFQSINKYLPQLEELTINTLLVHEPYYVTGQVHFKSLKIFDHNFSELLLKINFSFDQLEEFHAEGIRSDNLLTFVRKYLTIKKLELCYTYGDFKENVIQVAKALSLLYELQLYLCDEFSVDEVIRIVNIFKQVEKLHLKLHYQSEVDDLRAKLGSKWKISIDPEKETFVILQKGH